MYELSQGDYIKFLVPFVGVVTLAVFFALFLYLFVHTRERSYLWFVVLTAISIGFVGMELTVIYFGVILRDWANGVYFHRAEQLFPVLYFFALPCFASSCVYSGSRFRKFLNVVAIVGMGLSAAFAVIAFLKPDLYISISTQHARAAISPFDLARGREGPAYIARDVLLGIWLLGTDVVFFIETFKRKSFSYLLPISVGLLIAIWFIASDILFIYLNRNIDPLFFIGFSRTPAAVTIFLVISATGILNRFIEKNDQLAAAFSDLRQSEKKLNDTTESMARFLPNEFLTYLGKSSILEASLGDCVKMPMTVLFSDIRSFTSISEGLSPEENYRFINEYFELMVPIIRDYDGFVDKFVGDAIMALFPGGPDDAAKAAVEMRRALRQYNQRRLELGGETLRVGIGIHAGEAMLGIVGDRYRMEGTVISDAVNLASRMQSLTKVYGLDVLLSDEAFRDINDHARFDFRFIGKARVKGKTVPVSVFEIFTGDSDELHKLKVETHSDFERGVIALYSCRFTEAERHFEAVLGTNPNDGAAAFYRRWLKNHKSLRQVQEIGA